MDDTFSRGSASWLKFEQLCCALGYFGPIGTENPVFRE